MGRKHALAEMTAVEFRQRLAERPVILLPLGSQEVQGPHAPMGDFMLTERIARLAAEAAGAIAAPTVPFGWADFFRPIPGGIQLRPTTFTALLEDVAYSFLEHGIEHVVVLNGHTSNAPLIDQVVRGLRYKRGIIVPSINLWQAISPALWTELYGDDAVRARGHGGDPITSVYLHLLPDLMRPDLVREPERQSAFGLPTAGVRAVTFEGLPVALPLDVTDVEPNGLLGGDPRLATAEIGAAITDHLVGFITRFCQHFRRCTPRAMSAGPTPR